jgi:pre-mRNA-splicing factor CWC26
LSVNELINTQEGHADEADDANMEWGTGLVQKNKKDSEKDYEDSEKVKPFARYVDDEDLNEHYKEQDRWGDPMANLVSKKEKKVKKDKKDKKEKVVVKPTPRWKGASAPGNRYNIVPGWRWDGVDRSNGFEIKILTKEATDVAKAEQGNQSY